MTSPGLGEDPTPPDTRVAELPDDPEEKIYSDPEVMVDVMPPVDVVSVDHAEPSVEPPQVYPGAASGRDEVTTVERRLRVHGLFRMPDLSAAVSSVARVERLPAHTIYEVYYDTADLRLARWGATLCRRQGGADEGWHLSLPVEATKGELDEVRLPLGETEDMPPILSDLVVAFRRNEPLVPVASLRTERTEYVLKDATGHGAARVLDDTVSVLDGEHIAARFRELEVVATDVDAALDPIVQLLAARGALPGAPPRAMTALGPVTQEPADIPDPQVVSPQDPAGAAVTAHIRRHAKALLLQDVRVRRDLPDSVHQMRVAARRLRSGLKVFEPLLEVEWAQSLREELGWVAGELGVSRDTEVLMARLDHHADEVGIEFAPLIRAVVDPTLSEQWRDAREHAMAAMSSPRYFDFLDRLVDAARRPRLTDYSMQPGEYVLPGLVDKAWRKLEKEIHHLRLDGPSPPWHEARIRAKKARYAAEAVAPVLGDRLKQFAKSLSSVTEVLGEHQDAWVAQQTLKSMAASPGVDGLAGFSLGLLHEFEFQQEMFDRKDFMDLWPSVKRSHKKAQLG